jgi:hypothetical protein
MARKTAQSFAELPVVRFGDLEDDTFGKGEEFQGYYKGSKIVKTKKYGDKTVYTFQTAEGDVQIWGSANLNQKMGQVKLGSLTFITYEGEQKSKERGKNPTKLFKVEYDDAEAIDVDVPQVSFRGEPEEEQAEEQGAEDDVDQELEEQEEEETPPARSAKTASKPAAQSKAPASNAAAASSAKDKLKNLLNKNKATAA